MQCGCTGNNIVFVGIVAEIILFEDTDVGHFHISHTQYVVIFVSPVLEITVTFVCVRIDKGEFSLHSQAGGNGIIHICPGGQTFETGSKERSFLVQKTAGNPESGSFTTPEYGEVMVVRITYTGYFLDPVGVIVEVFV